jgi:hypothetical protein
VHNRLSDVRQRWREVLQFVGPKARELASHEQLKTMAQACNIWRRDNNPATGNNKPRSSTQHCPRRVDVLQCLDDENAIGWGELVQGRNGITYVQFDIRR